MRYLLALLLLISVSATAQYSPTAAKTRFVNGIGLGTKDTATMNAADTVAMIIGRDSLVYFKYKGYWKALAYNSSLTGYVPYTGATSSVNLGAYNLTATKIAIGGSISAVALDVHRAGSIVARIENTNSSQDALFAYAQSAQNVWFTGIDYASGANNFGFYYSPDGTTVTRKAYFSLSGDLTANSFIKSGGTSAQFLKADGSVTTTIPSGSIDTGRAATAIATGGSLNKVRDSLQANIGLKLNISDTATMLSSYYNKTATDSRLALKVNYTDTSTMLSPYQRAYNAVKYTDTASMLTGYKTYYPRAALSAGTGISYNNTTGVITNSSPSTGGTVTSVATNTGSGITGGTITTSGTIAADTSVLSTKANVTALLLSKVSSVSGTSPIVSSGGTTPAISIPVATTSVNGYLSSTDWTTFNNKQSALTNPVTGSGTTNYLPKFTGASTIGNSAITDDGTTVTLVSRALSGTSATFSATLTAQSNIDLTGDLRYQSNAGYGLKSQNGTRLFEVYNTGVSFVTPITGTSATFSSSVYSSGVLQVAPTTGTGMIGVGDNFGGNINAGIYRGGLGVTTAGNYLNIGGYDGVVVTTGNAALGSQTTRLTIASTGEATFSSTLGINGVADNVKSGTYTPTIASVYNVASSSANPCQYMRVGNVVTVSGSVSLTATATNTWTRLSITLPISSSFDYSYRAGGGGGANATNNVCVILAGASTSVVYLDAYPNSTSGLSYFFSFTYLIM